MLEVTANDVNVSTYWQMRLLTGGDATGLTIADFDLSYAFKETATAAKVDATALAAVTTAHTDNYGIELDATDQPGLYRFDFPDAAFVDGESYVILTVKHASCFTESMYVPINLYNPRYKIISTSTLVTYHDVNDVAIATAVISSNGTTFTKEAAG